MRTLLLFLLIGTGMLSCSKNSSPIVFHGIWVEQSLHMDTLDFEKGYAFGKTGSYESVFFRSKSFFDASINPNFPTNLSTAYGFYVERDSIFLRNYLSSSLRFNSYTFRMNNDGHSFQIGNFYTRTGLSAPILVFERIQ